MMRRIHEVLVIDNISECSFSDSVNSDLIKLEEFQLKTLSGCLSNSDEYLSLKVVDNKKMTSFHDLVKDAGEWFGLFLNEKNEAIVSSDYFGFASLYYSFVNVNGICKLVISNSFRGVSSFLRDLGVIQKVDWNVVLPHLITNTNLFLTRASFKTFSNKIFVLDYRNFIYIANNKVYLLNKDNFITIGDNKNYNSILLSGIDNAIADFNKYASSMPVCFNLSGGKDSRVALSMLLNSQYKNNISVSTSNPFTLPPGPSKDILMSDFEISSIIVQKYGLKWFKRNNYEQVKITYNEQLNIWQDFRSNSSFELKNKTSQLKKCEEIRIMGIGGELVRSYLGATYKENFPQWWKKINSGALNLDDKLRLLFRELCQPWMIDESLYAAAMESFVESFKLTEGDVLEQLDESYLNYRSRAHAGVGSLHSFEGSVLKYPLCQLEFRHANSMLDEYERDNGKVLFDIIKLTTPELNHLKFASPAWPKVFFDNSQINCWENLSGKDAIAAYMRVQSEKREYTLIESNGIIDYDVNIVAFERLNNNINIISSLCSNEMNLVSLVERIARLQQKNTAMLHSLVAKTESIIDVLLPPSVSKNTFTYNLHNFKISSALHPVFDSVELKSVVNSIDLSRCDAVLRLNDENTLILDLIDIPHDCSVALYIYVDGVRKDIVWYSKMDQYVYSLENSLVNKVRMMVFIKRDGEPEAQRVINSEIILR